MKSFKFKRFFSLVLVCLVAALMHRTWKAYTNFIDYRVLHKAHASDLQTTGDHIITGFKDWDHAKTLALKWKVAGLYVNRHNIGKDIGETKEQISWLQSQRRLHGLPPLILCTDQEGGEVNRLSPPLMKYPPLSAFSSNTQEDAKLQGRLQGAELRRMGINMNLAPVVDLMPEGRAWYDLYSRLDLRSISGDPEQVATVAGAYAEGLRNSGIFPVYKHFPGLRSVAGDTHLHSGVVKADKGTLHRSDWYPYQSLFQNEHSAIMIAHAILPSHDKERIASCSGKIMQKLMRDSLGFQGIIISDDACMRPFRHKGGGMSENALHFLNGGGDLLLISYKPELTVPVLADLVRYLNAGDLDLKMLEKSKARLQKQGFSNYPGNMVTDQKSGSPI